MEEWKNINENYKVSNEGRIYSEKTKKILKPNLVGSGYLKVDLYNNGKRKIGLIHQLVANAFIDNPNGYKEINHKDKCKTNNKVENLEWCDIKYNNEFSDIQETLTEKKKKQVFQYDLDGKLVAVWASLRECERETKYSESAISRCCLGLQKQHKGYIWKYN